MADVIQRIALVGAGKLGGFLAPALAQASFRILEVVARDQPQSLKRAQALARSVGARVVTESNAALQSDALWLAVPDAEIRRAAESLAQRAAALHSQRRGPRFAFHSSGALGSEELAPLRKLGVATASVHPLMTFVAGSQPSLSGVPFAIEGDGAAVSAARSLVRRLGGVSFVLPARRKAAYHAWATMTSPLLLAYLVTLEEVSYAAGLNAKQARKMSLPILRQTLENYGKLGPGGAFSGPFIRGDAETVAKHLALLKRSPKARAVYTALARAALDELPVRNRKKLTKLLGD